MIVVPAPTLGTTGSAQPSPVSAQGGEESGFSGVADRLRELLDEHDGTQLPALASEADDDAERDAHGSNQDGEGAKAADGEAVHESMAVDEADTAIAGETAIADEAEGVIADAADVAATSVLAGEASLSNEAFEVGENMPTAATKKQLADPTAQLWHLQYRQRVGAEHTQTAPMATDAVDMTQKMATHAKAGGERLVGMNTLLVGNKLLLQQLSATSGPASVMLNKEEAAVQSTTVASVTNAALGVARGMPTHEWAPITVTPGNKATLGSQLMLALKDKVELQLNQEVQQARIKLDPPEMGRLELSIRLEGDRLHIQINASQSAVREALIAQADKLRNDLLPHHSGGVEVNVGQGEQQQQGGQPDREYGVSLAQSDVFESAPQESLGRGWVNALV